MALNRTHSGDSSQYSLPVPEGTSPGDPVLVGALPGVAMTARGGIGNVDGHATVETFRSPVYRLPVTTGEGDGLDVGDRVYIDGSGDLSDNDAGTAYGYALEAVADETTATIDVKVGA